MEARVRDKKCTLFEPMAKSTKYTNFNEAKCIDRNMEYTNISEEQRDVSIHTEYKQFLHTIKTVDQKHFTIEISLYT